MKKGIVFLIGCLLCFYPIVSNTIEEWRQRELISTYQSEMNGEEEEKLEEMLKQAEIYNSLLFQAQGTIIEQSDFYDEKYYSSQLNISGNGIMGSLEIPKIDVKLPIYHGTEEEALSNGAGHIKGTSLPVGGKNTHAVLSGHRGLPSSKLFVRLDELEKGDYFFIRTCDQNLAYKVLEIKVVEPDDVSSLEIKAGEDLVSLVTCTPYGLNTHRMIVTGARVEYEESIYDSIDEAIPSGREIIITVFPFILLLLMFILHYADRRKRKNENN